MKPIIKITDLNYTDAQKKEVKIIQKEIRLTTRRDKLRNLLKGPMCCCCSEIPTKRIETDMDGIIRIECWCDLHFHEVYENTIDLSNASVAERYNCTIAPPGTFGGSKKEGYEYQ